MLILEDDYQKIFEGISIFLNETNQGLNTKPSHALITAFKKFIGFWLSRSSLVCDEKTRLKNIQRLNEFLDTFNYNFVGKRKFKIVSNGDFLRILDFLHKKANGTIAFRNSLIIIILFETGLRIGELLNLKSDDLVQINENYYLLVRDHSFRDPRAFSPSIKNGFGLREIAISQQTFEKTQEYIQKHRRSVGKAGKAKINHPFLFVSTSSGRPITRSALADIFRKINNYSTLSVKLTPHVFRHTFAYNFLKFLIEDKGLDLERAKDQLRCICGWSYNSEMPSLYGSKYIWEEANSANIKRLNALNDKARNSEEKSWFGS